MLKTENYYRGNNIEVLRNSHVTEIDRINKTIRIEEGIKNISYDKLVIATGSTLNKLKLRKENNKVHYIRTINDANSIKNKLQSGKKIIIVGGGYIGLELASIAIKKTLEVMIIEAGDYLMSRTTSRQMSEFFSDKHKSMVVKINFNQSVQINNINYKCEFKF